jgi:hypothetical protein
LLARAPLVRHGREQSIGLDARSIIERLDLARDRDDLAQDITCHLRYD